MTQRCSPTRTVAGGWSDRTSGDGFKLKEAERIHLKRTIEAIEKERKKAPFPVLPPAGGLHHEGGPSEVQNQANRCQRHRAREGENDSLSTRCGGGLSCLLREGGSNWDADPAGAARVHSVASQTGDTG